MVACWPLTMRAALSLFSVNITSMFLCGKMGSQSMTEAQGMLVMARPGKRFRTTISLIRWAAFREMVIIAACGCCW